MVGRGGDLLLGDLTVGIPNLDFSTVLVSAVLATESAKRTVELAYLAGFFDGEGSIQILGAGGMARLASCDEARMSLRVTVTNSNYGSLERFRHYFGGAIHPLHKILPPQWRRTYAWMLAGSKAASVLSDLLPFLAVKREQAEIVLLFAETYHSGWREHHHNRITREAATLRGITYRAFRNQINRQGGRGRTDFGATL